MNKLQIVSSYIDVSPNEYVTKFSINRNFIKLIDNDNDISKHISESGTTDVVQSFVSGKTYLAGSYIFYKTTQQSQGLYLLESLKTTNIAPTTIKNSANELIVVNSEDWKIVGIPSTIDRNPVDIALEYVETATSSFISAHQHNVDLSAHPTEELGLSSSTIAFTTFENISDDRNTLFYPNTLKSLTPDNTIVGGYMRKWDNGLLEYDLIFRVGYFGDNTDTGYQILSANNLIASQANYNGLYFKNSDDLRIFAQGDDYYVIADKTKQVNLNTNVNSFYGQITFPEQFKDLNYMCFTSNLKTLESEAKSVANIVLQKSTYDDRLLIDGLALEGVKENASTIAKFVIPKQLKTFKSYSLAGLYEENQYPVQVEIDKDSDLVNVEEYTFAESQMRKLTIPKNVRCIGKYAFSGCSYLTSIDFYISKDLAKQPIVDFDVFQNCGALSSINLHYVSDNTPLFGASIDDERNIAYRNDYDLSVKFMNADYRKYFGIESNVAINIIDEAEVPRFAVKDNTDALMCQPISLTQQDATRELQLIDIIQPLLISSDSENSTLTINPQINDVQSFVDAIATAKSLQKSNNVLAAKQKSRMLFSADSTAQSSDYDDSMFMFNADKTQICGYTAEFSCKEHKFDLNDNYFSSITAISKDAFKSCTLFSELSCKPNLLIETGAFEAIDLDCVDIDLRGNTLISRSSFKNANIGRMNFRNLLASTKTQSGLQYNGFSVAALSDIVVTGNVCSVYFSDVSADAFISHMTDEKLSSRTDLSIYQENVAGFPDKTYITVNNGSVYIHRKAVDSDFSLYDVSYLLISGTEVTGTRKHSITDDTIHIPEFITKIDNVALTNLTVTRCKLDVPNSVTSLGNQCFVCSGTYDYTFSKVNFAEGFAPEYCGNNIFDISSQLSNITVNI